MARYVAFLRGVSPLNAKMADLKRCFEAAGFKDVKTVLGSGNVVFDSSAKSVGAIEQKAEAAMKKELGRVFYTIVRPVAVLGALIEADPYRDFDLPAGAKRVVTFMREQRSPAQPLPIERDGAHLLKQDGREVFSAYVPNPQGPVFMTLIEKAYGSDVTTRTWETLKKCVA